MKFDVNLGIVQRKRLHNKLSNKDDKNLENAPRIHGLVFDTAHGTLQRLNVDYSRVGSLESIYALYWPSFNSSLEDFDFGDVTILKWCPHLDRLSQQEQLFQWCTVVYVDYKQRF